MVIGGRQVARDPPQQRNVIVIGQEYSDFRDSQVGAHNVCPILSRHCETSRMFVDSCNVQAEVVDARSVVGSRYGSSSASARQSPASRGGSGYTVVGAGFRRRRSLDTFLSLVL